MNYQETTERIRKNFPIILEAYKISWDQEHTPETDEAYAIRRISEGIQFTNDMNGIDWKKGRRFISKEKIDAVKEYYNTIIELGKKFKSFSTEEQKGLAALLNEQTEKIDAFE